MLNAVLDNLDGLDEKYKDLYVEKNGKFVLIPIEGLKPKAEFDVVYNALGKERNDHKVTKTSLTAFEGLNPTEVREKLDRIAELELAAAGKLDDKAIDQLVVTRLQSKVAPIERARDQAVRERDELAAQVAEFKTTDKKRRISDKVTAAARGAKLLDTAHEDAVLLAERIFDVDEAGNVVTKDNVGVTPGLTPDLWLSDMQTKRPHWWGPSQGGGAAFRGGQAGGPNPFTAEGWNLTEQGKLISSDRARAAKLAEQAGTTIGGRKPEPRK
jgi:hypothetical protein